MADYRQIIIKYGTYIELVAYLLALISIFLPFKSVSEVKETSYGKRDDTVIKEIYKEINHELAKYNKSGNASFINFTTGVIVLIFIIISAVIVAINSFAYNAIEKLKEKVNFKFFGIIIELIPLTLTIFSVILTLIGTDNNDEIVKLNIARIKLAYGFFLLLIALIVAIALRIVYILLIKEGVKLNNKQKYVEQIDEVV